jgi:hypothetical protein
MYGAEIWSTTAKSNIKIVEQLQSTYLRRALDAPLYMRDTNPEGDKHRTHHRTYTKYEKQITRKT